MGRLDGKVAIVTGGGRGIGRAIAEAYLCEGARVTATAAREREEMGSLLKITDTGEVLPIVAEPAIYFASNASCHLTGHRIVAPEWSPDDFDGSPVSGGLGATL